MTDTATLPFSVNLWGSHPDLENDDCWTGDDFATLEEARDAFERWDQVFSAKARAYASHVELDGPDVHEVKQVATNAQIARWRRQDAEDAASERREAAMQAGMAFGCQGFNDEMGW